MFVAYSSSNVDKRNVFAKKQAGSKNFMLKFSPVHKLANPTGLRRVDIRDDVGLSHGLLKFVHS